MNKEKRIDYFLQLVMVILGVFLGMLASDWNSENNFNQNKLNLLNGLKTEIQSNVNYLKSRKSKDIEPFFKSLDSLSALWNADSTFLKQSYVGDIEKFPKFPELGRAKLDDAMFEATKYSNILSSFEIELLKQITKAYNLQYNIEDQHYKFSQRITFADTGSTNEEVKTLMWQIMQDYFGSQYNLIKEYEATIEHINILIAEK
ncbi:hypothetical protein [Pontimicrobium sp. MEBiC06410]